MGKEWSKRGWGSSTWVRSCSINSLACALWRFPFDFDGLMWSIYDEVECSHRMLTLLSMPHRKLQRRVHWSTVYPFSIYSAHDHFRYESALEAWTCYTRPYTMQWCVQNGVPQIGLSAKRLEVPAIRISRPTGRIHDCIPVGLTSWGPGVVNAVCDTRRHKVDTLFRFPQVKKRIENSFICSTSYVYL